MYYFQIRDFKDICEANRHAVYNHYFPKNESPKYELATFMGATYACIEEMYAFHSHFGWTADESREDYLLAEWLFNNDRVSESIIDFEKTRYGETYVDSLAHAIYEARKHRNR